MNAPGDDLARSRAFYIFAAAARRVGRARLSDDELLHLLAEHRWALTILARPGCRGPQRGLLNAGALAAHGALYDGRRVRGSAVGRALRRGGGEVALSALTFVVSGLVAMAIVHASPVLAVVLVPRDFLAHIDAHAWGARGSTGADIGMTLFYWANNLRASFLALGLGVLAGFPGLAVIAYNGLLLGAVTAVAIQHGVGDRLLGWVAPHGVPEMSALVICGGIGAALGRSWLSPGALGRREALAEAARELLPLVLVAGALVLIAAPLEGFVAPLELPRWLDLGIALGWALVLAAGARYTRAMDREGGQHG